MVTKYILLALSALFVTLAITRIARGGNALHPQARTWLIIGILFGAVSAWLFYAG